MADMTKTVIGMPYEMAMESEISRRQFWDRAQLLLDENEELMAKNEQLRAENEELMASLGSPDEMSAAEPAGDYEALRRQFLALRAFANAKCRMAAHWQKQCGRETYDALLANAANVNAERDTNALLTDALEAAEEARDQILSELEAEQRRAAVLEQNCAEMAAGLERARQDAERYRADSGGYDGKGGRADG